MSSAPVAVVTGASRGIGKQLCVDLAAAGYDVVCVARASADRPTRLPGTVDDTAALVRDQGRRAMTAPLDVRHEEAVGRLAERVHEEWGRCDLLINNAAVAVPGPSLQLPPRHWKLVVDVNLNGPFWFVYHFCPKMENGRVVNISAGASVMPEFGRASYTVTKRGLEALTESLAFELRGRVAVNAIRLDLGVWSEGFVATLPEGDHSSLEDPVIMSDATLWLARQPLDYTGNILTVRELRERGVVRPRTPVGER